MLQVAGLGLAALATVSAMPHDRIPASSVLDAQLQASLQASVQNEYGTHAPVLDVAAIRRRDTAPGVSYTPTVLMHGLGDAGSNAGMKSLAQTIEVAYPGSYATAVDVADGFLSFVVPVQQQVDELAATIQADPKLANGFNLVGLSQGGLIVRVRLMHRDGWQGRAVLCIDKRNTWPCTIIPEDAMQPLG